MDACWKDLPDDVFLAEIACHLSIDVRMAFQVPPGKVLIPSGLDSGLQEAFRKGPRVLYIGHCRRMRIIDFSAMRASTSSLRPARRSNAAGDGVLPVLHSVVLADWRGVIYKPSW